MIALDAVLRLERFGIAHQHNRCRIARLHRLEPWLEGCLYLRHHAFTRLELNRASLEIYPHGTLLFAAPLLRHIDAFMIRFAHAFR